jgi:hypothetical protein
VPPPLTPRPDVELGAIEATTCEPIELRVAIPIADTFERHKAKARLEAGEHERLGGDGILRITDQAIVGNRLAVTVHVVAQIHGEYPMKFHVDVGTRSFKATGKLVVKHGRPAPFGMASMIGSQSSADVPYQGQLWANARYKAVLQQTGKEFRITANHGTMEAGAKVFPFKVIFTPRDPKPVVATLFVTFNDTSEYCVEVTGSVCGFQGKSWGRRQHGALLSSASKAPE